MFNLIEQLTDTDRETIQNYIYTYGINKDGFIGLDNWLQNWNYSNQLLYKLLGNQLIYKTKISYEKSRKELIEDFGQLQVHPFSIIYIAFANKIIREKYDNIWSSFIDITNVNTYAKNELKFPINLKKEDSKNKLQLQIGAKPVKALSKIVTYFNKEFEMIFKKASEKKIDAYYCTEDFYEKISKFKNVNELFEDFRIKHSLILNDKKIKGDLFISIHPMDFITMSDNNSNWTSCMSWKNDGCYKIGTVEMMNSNCVLCCYLVNTKKDFIFNSDIKENNIWNNKRWRNLIYFNKDIIMSGKSYPYPNDFLNKIAITEIKKLAEKNLNRKFSFGPELYQDMIYIDSMHKMEVNRTWMKHPSTDIKKNILWDTKGMYNDILCSPSTPYWCYRNAVKHKKIYNVSGKALCLCCGGTVIEEEEYPDSYCERYYNANNLICSDCLPNYKCSCCKTIIIKNELYKVNYNNDTKIYCKSCFEKFVKKCPCCGEPFDLKEQDALNYENETAQGWYYYPGKKKILEKTIDGCDIDRTFILYDLTEEKEEKISKDIVFIEKIYFCKNCNEKMIDKYFRKVIFDFPYYHKKRAILSDPFLINMFRYKNLKSVDYTPLMKIN